MDVSQLYGLWTHSWEESKGNRHVYRGRSYNFPMARAPRDSFQIEPDGTVTTTRPGPADDSLSIDGTWEIHDDRLVLSRPGRRDVYRVEHVDDAVLILQRL